MGLRLERSTHLELLAHPTYGRHAKTGKGRNLTGAFALFVELNDPFTHGDRYGSHASSLPSRYPRGKLHFLWKCFRNREICETREMVAPKNSFAYFVYFAVNLLP